MGHAFVMHIEEVRFRTIRVFAASAEAARDATAATLRSGETIMRVEPLGMPRHGKAALFLRHITRQEYLTATERPPPSPTGSMPVSPHRPSRTAPGSTPASPSRACALTAPKRGPRS